MDFDVTLHKRHVPVGIRHCLFVPKVLNIDDYFWGKKNKNKNKTNKKSLRYKSIQWAPP